MYEPIITLGNLIQLAALVVTIAGGVIYWSKFAARTEIRLHMIEKKIDEIATGCKACSVWSRLDRIEKKQHDMREELPARLARIENDLVHIKDMLEIGQVNRKGRRDRADDHAEG